MDIFVLVPVYLTREEAEIFDDYYKKIEKAINEVLKINKKRIFKLQRRLLCN